ncbi:major facilitator superfamily domain-containing protein [Lophiotrema nucula]|uniref:Major facilitator superfamily domain-containing protein n=1 Tax=Lophiotrema nucula TaxID=690887 RepID=A0A6A5Z7E9_9PLEO|nr:major facilitator superfamily domain-containing protein [Lophiotrema nucula]
MVKECSPSLNRDSCASDTSVQIVDFSDNDPENPFNWPRWRKWTIAGLVTVATFMGNYGTITIVPAVPGILHDFDATNSDFYLTFLVSIWELGEAVGQFFVGPAAERFGRMPVFLVGNALFTLCSVGSALSVSVEMLTAFRFLNGCVNSTLTLSPNIIGDLFAPEHRGRAMAISVAVPLLGPFVAPVIGSYVNASMGWRWTVWVVVLVMATVTGLSCISFKETYKVKILQRRTDTLQRASTEEHFRSKYEAEQTGVKGILLSTIRPASMLFSCPKLFLVAMFNGLTYGISYLILTTLASVLQDVYHFDDGDIGNAYLARALGNVIAMLFYGLTSDRYLKHMQKKHGSSKPSHRLLHMLISSILLPVGLILYGWTARSTVHWVVPLIGTAIVGCSMILSMLPTNNYLVDTYEVHGASAVAAAMIVMSFSGTFFPLIGSPLYRSALGLGWGNSVLALITVLFIPPLALVLRSGSRSKSEGNFA